MSSETSALPIPLVAHMVATYKSLRRLLVGVALAFVVLLLVYRYFGDDQIPRHSVSAYYHNPGRLFEWLRCADLFVGSFAAVGLMLIAYKGYTWWESRLLNVAGGALLVVAFCPMEWGQPNAVAKDIALAMTRSEERAEFVAASVTGPPREGASQLRETIGKARTDAEKLAGAVGDSAPQDALPRTWRGWAHYAGAFGFFFGIAWVCWFHALDTLALVNDRARQRRYTAMYRLTSLLMALVPVMATGLYWVGLRSWVFWVELSGVLIFVLYWSIKSWELSGVQLTRPGGGPTPVVRGL